MLLELQNTFWRGWKRRLQIKDISIPLLTIPGSQGLANLIAMTTVLSNWIKASRLARIAFLQKLWSPCENCLIESSGSTALTVGISHGLEVGCALQWLWGELPVLIKLHISMPFEKSY